MTNHITTAATLENLRKLFAQFGLPEVIVSDNGAQFMSAEFTEFCVKNGTEHIRVPLYHLQSNGQAKHFVDTFKRSLIRKKAEGVKGAIQTFLFHYRSTQFSAIEKKSPAKLFLGRQLRLTLDFIQPTARQQRRRNEKMEQQFNRHHGARKRQFTIGDAVLVKDHYANCWIPATVRRRLGNVVYQVETKHGMWYKHANQIQQRTSSNRLNATGMFSSLFNTFALDDPILPVLMEVGELLKDQEQLEHAQQQDPHSKIRLRRSSQDEPTSSAARRRSLAEVTSPVLTTFTIWIFLFTGRCWDP
uniref:Integrase catalytic domain-containing protein n=1 Tax=Trichuris muris TaxID=70415 RepID=A0A5S6Q5U1_TRIMR